MYSTVPYGIDLVQAVETFLKLHIFNEYSLKSVNPLMMKPLIMIIVIATERLVQKLVIYQCKSFLACSRFVLPHVFKGCQSDVEPLPNVTLHG